MSILGEPSCQITPCAVDSILNVICLPLILTFNCSVYFSTGAVAVRVTEPLLLPPSDVGLLIPEPELLKGERLNVAVGLSTVDPSNVISGSIRLTNANLSPSSISN